MSQRSVGLPAACRQAARPAAAGRWIDLPRARAYSGALLILSWLYPLTFPLVLAWLLPLYEHANPYLKLPQLGPFVPSAMMALVMRRTAMQT